ncbi:MAG TPA: RecX family transcriptional regulator [Bryobacteraceae bacterium]|nr:RecX family transcriptional regulator [Bryobacteraceae bacterium]
MEKRAARRLDAAALWSYSLRILGGRAHSTGELRQKLARRAADENDVESTIARLKDCGYLDDRRFAEGYAAARLSNDKFGRARVIHDLRQRRVAPPLAERTVQHVYQEVDEEGLIEAWIRRKYRMEPREGLFQEDKDLASAYRRLLRAGFRTGDILRVLKRFAKNPALLDDFEPPDEPDTEE